MSQLSNAGSVEAEDAPRVARSHPSARVDAAISRATAGLLHLRKPDGHWCFELESDATIPAEYVLFLHFLGEEDPALEARIGVYLRRTQQEDGGWPLCKDGASDISASIKAYFGLKMIGDPPDAPHMVRAREAILARGGAGASNVFTRILLALYGEIPWTGVPVMPVEIMLLPRWFPFHLSKISYWARTVLVPLLVLQALKPRAINRRNIGIAELFPAGSEVKPHRPAHAVWPWTQLFEGIDKVLRPIEPFFPKGSRQRAIDKAVAFVDERLNGTSGLGAIYPAMANSVIMYHALGVPPDDDRVRLAREAIDGLLTDAGGEEAYCQPCLSPVWDTVLSAHALLETEAAEAISAAVDALRWLAPRQVLDFKGDWAFQRPNVRPGGWAFQYANPHYPDLDDTAVVVMGMLRAMHHLGPDQFALKNAFETAIERGAEWIEGLQSRDGGWAAFDADNSYFYLNYIPFSDHGALLDPPTADLTARCVSMLMALGHKKETRRSLDDGLKWLLDHQEADGSWFGRWGMNYIYGTWSALTALAACHDAEDGPVSGAIAKGAQWLASIQNADGGWGEGGDSYKIDYRGYEPVPSTASQTAWALLGLMAAGEARGSAVRKGIDYLIVNQAADGLWPEAHHTATGFPRVFYLRYHGYSKIFPLWALAQYRRLSRP